jgi:perosamine synthetase
MNQFIPVYEPFFSGNEAKYVNECLKSGWISSKGEFVGRFEQSFSNYLENVFSTSVCNGTVALHLALHTLGIGKGDEIIVPTLTYIASVNAIAYVGAKPVFVDSEQGTWNIDVSQVEAKITKKTKAIMAVHLYGAVCNMTDLLKICNQHGLLLIEDAAEAFGSMYNGQFVGTFGDIATFSFFGNKTITTGEGGMVVSKNKQFIERASYLKFQAVSPEREYWHDEIGFNYRMTNICAAIGFAQLENAENVIRKKTQIANWYKENLLDSSFVFQQEIEGTIHSFWMVSILVESEDFRDLIRKELKKENIETRPIFYPAHVMPIFKSDESFPVAENLSKRGLNFPSFPSLTRETVDHICDVIKSVI